MERNKHLVNNELGRTRMEGIVISFVALSRPGIWLEWQSNHENHQARHPVSRTGLKSTITLIVEFIRSFTFRISVIYLLTNSLFNLLPISYSLSFSPCFRISFFLSWLPFIFLFLSRFIPPQNIQFDWHPRRATWPLNSYRKSWNTLQRVDASSYVSCTFWRL
jgi:hypothetical protein